MRLSSLQGRNVSEEQFPVPIVQIFLPGPVSSDLSKDCGKEAHTALLDWHVAFLVHHWNVEYLENEKKFHFN